MVQMENLQTILRLLQVWVKLVYTQILLDYKSGKRTETMMQKHAKGFSDEELEQIAYFFSKLKR